MFEHLGNNTAGSILAAIATLFCLVPAVLITFGPKLRGSSGPVAESAAGDDEKAAAAAEKAKTKKTVRWGDETDSGTDGSEETKSENATDDDSSGSSEISRTETKSEADGSEIISRVETTDVERRDFASPGIETRNQNGVAGASEISRAETKKSESGGAESAEAVARVETKGSSADDSGDGRKKEKKKEKTRGDDKDEDKDKGAVGFLGMDIERLAVIPYF